MRRLSPRKRARRSDRVLLLGTRCALPEASLLLLCDPPQERRLIETETLYAVVLVAAALLCLMAAVLLVVENCTERGWATVLFVGLQHLDHFFLGVSSFSFFSSSSSAAALPYLPSCVPTVANIFSSCIFLSFFLLVCVCVCHFCTIS